MKINPFGNNQMCKLLQQKSINRFKQITISKIYIKHMYKTDLKNIQKQIAQRI